MLATDSMHEQNRPRPVVRRRNGRLSKPNRRSDKLVRPFWRACETSILIRSGFAAGGTKIWREWCLAAQRPCSTTGILNMLDCATQMSTGAPSPYSGFSLQPQLPRWHTHAGTRRFSSGTRGYEIVHKLPRSLKKVHTGWGWPGRCDRRKSHAREGLPSLGHSSRLPPHRNPSPITIGVNSETQPAARSCNSVHVRREER